MSKFEDKILILCREYDKFEGRAPIIYNTGISQDSITNNTIKYLNLRSCLNPELAYFFVLESNWKENEEQVKKDILNEHKYQEFDDFIDNGNSILENRGIIKI